MKKMSNDFTTRSINLKSLALTQACLNFGVGFNTSCKRRCQTRKTSHKRLFFWGNLNASLNYWGHFFLNLLLQKPEAVNFTTSGMHFFFHFKHSSSGFKQLKDVFQTDKSCFCFSTQFYFLLFYSDSFVFWLHI